MTSEEIQNIAAGTVEVWLKEIALQLAIVNEANERADLVREQQERIRHRAVMATLGGTRIPELDENGRMK